MYLTKLAQRSGEDSNAVTYADLASVVQVIQWFLTIKIKSTVDVRKRNVLFGKSNTFVFGYWTFGFRSFGLFGFRTLYKKEPKTSKIRTNRAFGWSRSINQMSKIQTILKSAEIRTFGFRTSTVGSSKHRSQDNTLFGELAEAAEKPKFARLEMVFP